MSALLPAILAACLLLPLAGRAEDESTPVRSVSDAVYKGVVGKALDAVPMDPEQRVVLQRANAVVGNTFTGRSLSVWVGFTNPILMIGGLVWGLYAAYHIKPDAAKSSVDTSIVEPKGRVELAEKQGLETADYQPVGAEAR